jgi:hypothetical protein
MDKSVMCIDASVSPALAHAAASAAVESNASLPTGKLGAAGLVEPRAIAHQRFGVPRASECSTGASSAPIPELLVRCPSLAERHRGYGQRVENQSRFTQIKSRSPGSKRCNAWLRSFYTLTPG